MVPLPLGLPAGERLHRTPLDGKRWGCFDLLLALCYLPPPLLPVPSPALPLPCCLYRFLFAIAITILPLQLTILPLPFSCFFVVVMGGIMVGREWGVSATAAGVPCFWAFPTVCMALAARVEKYTGYRTCLSLRGEKERWPVS